MSAVAQVTSIRGLLTEIPRPELLGERHGCDVVLATSSGSLVMHTAVSWTVFGRRLSSFVDGAS